MTRLIILSLFLTGCAFQGPNFRLGDETRKLNQAEAELIVVETIKKIQEQARAQQRAQQGR